MPTSSMPSPSETSADSGEKTTSGTPEPSANIPCKSLAELTAPLEADLKRVKAAFQNIVPPDSKWLAESLAYSLGSTGKMVRPSLGLLLARAMGSQQADHIETMAAAEMIHVATLLHDDVLDDADLRRGRPTVRQQWGNTVSILSGDYLLAQASRTLAKLGHIRVVAIFSDVLADLCDGEVEQLRSQYTPDEGVPLDVNWDSYYQKTIGKTASLFAAVSESSAYLCGRPETEIQACRQFGKSLGIAFQIADDVLDYTSTAKQAGKPVMGDLKQGLLTAPILYALDSLKGQPERLSELTDALNQWVMLDDATNASDLRSTLLSILQDMDVFLATQQLARRHVEEAFQQLEQISGVNQDAVERLRGLAHLMVERTA